MKRFFLIIIIFMAYMVSTEDLGYTQKYKNSNIYSEAEKLNKDGNYAESYDRYMLFIFGSTPEKPVRNAEFADLPYSTLQDCLIQTISQLRRLNRYKEVDAYLDKLTSTYSHDWRVLRTVAELYTGLDASGRLVSGRFERGPRRDYSQVVNVQERDRVRSLQLFMQCIPLVEKDLQTLQKESDTEKAQALREEVKNFYFQYADAFIKGREYQYAYRLQMLTDLNTLPDVQPGWSGYDGYSPQGAPVDENGDPVYFTAPEDFKSAINDGQRWRWCMKAAIKAAGESDANAQFQADFQLADFLFSQFRVQTLASYGFRFGGDTQDAETVQGSIFSLDSLSDEETISRLATGVKRFKLPEEFQYIRLYETVADSDNPWQKESLRTLASIMLDRRQFPRAATYFKRLADLGDTHAAQVYEQITGNWGRFESEPTKPAGVPGKKIADSTPINEKVGFSFRYRNAKKVKFTATEINMEKLLSDAKKHLKERVDEKVKQLDRDKLQLEHLGYKLVQQNQKEYLGKEIAVWSLDLTPPERHFDRVTEVTAPFTAPGAYLIRADVENGNSCYIILWVADTAIICKQLDNARWYYVADAVTGQAIPNAKLSVFGYKMNYSNAKNNRGPKLIYHEFTTQTDASGQWIATKEQMPSQFSWAIIAEKENTQRMAFMGFQSIWFSQCNEQVYNEHKIFPMSDRPVYRPGQSVNFKFWANVANYAHDGASPYANKTCHIEIINPQGEKIWEKESKTDAYGGVADSFLIPNDAKLGSYLVSLRMNSDGINIINGLNGFLQFRVEEYKKPEYEVSVDAPKDPVMLGEKITAVINAKYYFGSPVTDATVKYKVTRTTHHQLWFPPAVWDWYYGPGYWWTNNEYPWYPGWKSWGCIRPYPIWSPFGYEQPEVVVENEVKIGPDGTVKVEFDTAVTKAIHPDRDHKYTISAEVTDQSRRVITGSGDVLVARTPFKVYAWTGCGYYRVGDVIRADFQARTLDGKPVLGNGMMRVFRVIYNNNGQPEETELFSEKINPNPEGFITRQIKASAEGQYRVAYTLTDSANHTQEGAQLITVTGNGFSGKGMVFNDLELIPDKGEYKPDETIKMMLNTNHENATVMLFLRGVNGICVKPQVINMKGKSQVIDIPVKKKDMPNFFVEALTVADGNVFTEMREICVPPEKRILNMEITPSKKEYKPGEKATALIKLTGLDGRPYTGAVVVTIYDKSLEYISGGMNTRNICEFFWKWRRHHNIQVNSSLYRTGRLLYPPASTEMSNLGAFGYMNIRAAGGIMAGGNAHMKNRFAVADSVMPMTARKSNFAATGGALPSAPLAAERSEQNNSFILEEEAVEADAAAVEAGVISDSSTLVDAVIRTKFADTAFWTAHLETDQDGTAEISLDMPENLTTWRILAWGMGNGTCVGQAQSEVVTRKNLILRMQTPRFLVTTDEILLTANIHNYLDSDKKVQVSLETPGTQLKQLDASERTITVKASGEARVDWRVKAINEGTSVIRMKALTDEESDAMELSVPVTVHGIMKQVAISGMLRPADKQAGIMNFTVPAQRRPAESRLEVRFSPTLAGAMVDALPYLVEYPYGCTEQTLNRFLPAVLTQKTLIHMGIDLQKVQQSRTNLNSQEMGNPQERAAQWGKSTQYREKSNPVFNNDDVSKIVKEGVEKLINMQCTDGGWGWFSGYGEHSTPYLTALVMHGLQTAKNNDVAVPESVLQRGMTWLVKYQNAQLELIKRGELKKPESPYKYKANSVDALVYSVLNETGLSPADADTVKMKAYLYRDRLALPRYAAALFGLALYRQGEKEKCAMIVENLSQYLVVDNENQTAWLDLGPGNCWWNWDGNEIETQASYLRLLCALGKDIPITARNAAELPDLINKKNDPESGMRLSLKAADLAPMMVKYLLNNRKHATYWNSTRDTALVIEAFSEFLKVSGEITSNMTIEVWLDGKKVKTVEVTPENLFSIDNTFILEGEALSTGKHTVELRRSGKGSLYYNGYISYFTLEDFITSAGLEVKVDRKFYRLVRVEGDRAKNITAGARGQVVKANVEKYDRVELKSGDTVSSGDLLEVELSINSKNDYSFLMFEDMKPSGFETVDVRSGYNGNSMNAYVEYRDNRVVFFIQNLKRGEHSVAYRMRAEIPGTVSALPTQAEAMYAPELKANSDEFKIITTDKL